MQKGYKYCILSAKKIRQIPLGPQKLRCGCPFANTQSPGYLFMRHFFESIHIEYRTVSARKVLLL